VHHNFSFIGYQGSRDWRSPARGVQRRWTKSHCQADSAFPEYLEPAVGPTGILRCANCAYLQEERRPAQCATTIVGSLCCRFQAKYWVGSFSTGSPSVLMTYAFCPRVSVAFAQDAVPWTALERTQCVLTNQAHCVPSSRPVHTALWLWILGALSTLSS